MIDRFGKYSALAVRVAFEKLRHWARSPFLHEEQRAKEFAEMESEIAEQLFRTLAQLRGPAAKLGQQLSLESGLLPETYRQKLEQLQNGLPPMNYAVIAKVLRAEFNKPPEELFREFDPKPIAAASLGQVHRARLASGDAVAVKIMYPGIHESIRGDLSLLRGLLSPFSENLLLKRTIDGLEPQLMEEADYIREKENTAWFKERLSSTAIAVPTIYTDHCSSRVLTMQLMTGVPVGQLTDARDRNAAGQSLFDLCKFFFFQLGAIHADPHPGNYLYDAKNKELQLIDFGLVQRKLSEDALTLFRLLLTPGSDPAAMLELYGRLGADLSSFSGTEREQFVNQVILSYHHQISPLFTGTHHFHRDATLTRNLRVALFTHAFHPRLQNFSTEFTLLHKCIYGMASLLSNLEATVNNG